jgi:hypothetical protein
MKKIFILFILFTNILKAQDTVRYTKIFDNSITGNINQTDTKIQTNITYSGNNTLNINNLEIGSFTNYIIGISNKLDKNEFTQRLNIHKTSKDVYGFVTHSYNSSLLRKIADNNMLGVGIGYKNNYSRLKLNTSFGLIYGRTLFFNDSINYKLRYSARIKYQYKGNLINFLTEYYYQPTTDFKDLLVNGSIKVSFINKNGFSVTIEDVLNYSNMSTIKVIHNITIGLSYEINKSDFYIVKKRI